MKGGGTGARRLPARAPSVTRPGKAFEGRHRIARIERFEAKQRRKRQKRKARKR